MDYKVVTLNHEHCSKLLTGSMAVDQERAYLSGGSIAYCLLADDRPVFAGGVVNMQWKRGEAWLLPTPFFRKHPLICVRHLCRKLIVAASVGGFRRIQAYCSIETSTTLFDYLGFRYEATLESFGPNGETWHLYSKVFK